MNISKTSKVSPIHEMSKSRLSSSSKLSIKTIRTGMQKIKFGKKTQ